MRFHQLDLNHLITLETLLSERSLTRTAERLAITQPAVSNALNRLRRHFGDDLLVRKGQIMVCTPFAETILPQLREALLQLREIAFSTGGFDPKSAVRHIKVATSDYIAAIFVTEVVRRIAESAPNVSLSYMPMGADAITYFERGEIDAIIFPDGFLSFAKHPRLALFKERWVCIARSGNPSVGQSLTSEAYYALPRIVPPYRSFWPEEHWDPVQAKQSVPAVTLPFSATPWLVARSDYIAILPERFAKLHQTSLELRLVQLPDAVPQTDFIVQWHADTANDPFKQWLLDRFREVGESLEAAA